MYSTITQNMLDNLNQALKNENAPFIYEWSDISGCIMRTLPKHKFIGNFTPIISVTEEFYQWIDTWFKETYDIELSYNNDGSICWAKIV